MIRHMDDLEGYREELRNLGGQWDLLTILGQMSGTGTDMSETREQFQELTSELLSRLSRETLRNAVQTIGAKAQVAVDILIRNLFERTADIGFLATDDDVRQFLLSREAEGPDEAEAVKRLRMRFKEYVAKYSVYYNIILLDTAGKVLAQLDEANPVMESSDPLLAEALSTRAEYVEAFRKTDLQPAEERALVYGYRVTESNDSESGPLGVLCLCFRFDNEVEGIFDNLVDEHDWSLVLILDRDGRTIASSDPYQVPLGAKMDPILDEDYRLIRFGGREYIAKTCPTKGYQGYTGLGWQGHVMVPLDHAFEQTNREDLRAHTDEAVLATIMRDPQLFPPELRAIPLKADAIQRNLDRTVWNGNVQDGNTQSKVLLQNISAAGGRTKQVFESSIGNLHETVVSSILNQVAFQSALAVDIMDRNLYERANDCRWWALTSAFREILSKEAVSQADEARACGILKYINDLYTVYTHLMLYDQHGRIVAVSDPEQKGLIGQLLHADWISATLQLTDSQSYTVSPFEVSHLYGNAATYIYGASVKKVGQNDLPVGGIAIVFDSTPQFEAMLNDSLSRDENGAIQSGHFGVFCERSGRIISSSHSGLKPGTMLRVDRGLLEGPNGQSSSKIVEFDNTFYAVGSRVSAGYREYKTRDNYKNDVVALVFAPLAAANEVQDAASRNRLKVESISAAAMELAETVEVATFFMGDRCFGLETRHVDQAIDPSGLTLIPGAHELLLGKILHRGKALPVVDFHKLARLDKTSAGEESQVIAIHTSLGPIGFLADALGDIPTLDKKQVDYNATLLDAADRYTQGVLMPVDCSSHEQMVVLLDPDRLATYLRELGTFAANRKEHPGFEMVSTVAQN